MVIETESIVIYFTNARKLEELNMDKPTKDENYHRDHRSDFANTAAGGAGVVLLRAG